MKGAFALLAVPALLAGCLAGEPQAPMAPTGQIDGAVVDHLLRPFADQPVSLVQLERVDATSALGGFTFREVPIGFYTVTTTLDARSATQVVAVEAGMVSRVILQLLPAPEELPYIEAHSYRSPAEEPEQDGVCESCEWAVPLAAGARPDRVSLEATWTVGPLLGEDRDVLDILVIDDRGFPLHEGRSMTSPAHIAIDGLDIHPDATELRMQVRYGREFMPRTASNNAFTMDSVLTLFYAGAAAPVALE